VHINGSFTADNNTTTVNEYYTMAAYTDAAVNAGTCSGAGAPPSGVQTGCHDGVGDAGTWTRQWTTDSYLATNSVAAAATECSGCHGSFVSTFNTGTSPQHNNATIQANHSECKMCHLWPDATYGSIAWNSANHGDNSILMNSDATIAYNATNNWCSGGVCHPGDATRDMPGDSGWTVELLDGPSAACSN